MPSSLLCLLLVAACDAPDARVEQTSPNGAAVVVAAGSEAPAPAVQLPDYPGARVQTRVGGTAPIGASRGFVTVFETDDPVEKVIAFYDAAAREAGRTASTTVDREGRAVRIYGEGASGAGTVLAVTRREGEGATRIVITAGIAERALAGVQAREILQATPPDPARTASKPSKPADVRLQ
ncbi:MAG: hypothetical protein SNJ79_00770 [Sphingomonadaceae bacterium]